MPVEELGVASQVTILASTTESDTIELKMNIYLSVVDIDNDMHMYPVIPEISIM